MHKPEVHLFLSNGGSIAWPWHLLDSVPLWGLWSLGSWLGEHAPRTKGTGCSWILFRGWKSMPSCREYQLGSQKDLSSEPNPATILGCETLKIFLNFFELVSSALTWQLRFSAIKLVKTKRSWRESSRLMLHMPFLLLVFHCLKWTLPSTKSTSLDTEI